MQENETLDKFLGRLQQRDKKDVHARAAALLSREGLEFNKLHLDILRIFAKDQKVRLVTTNFDELFEQAAVTEGLFDLGPEVYRAPALPLGHDFSGIVHVHGGVTRPCGMVLTDRDFGRAYLTEGWARRFLVSLFRKYTLLFVGYSHHDTDMNYMARALPDSEAVRFALIGADRGEAQRWQELGITPITYQQSSSDDHSLLYEGIERQANSVRRGVLGWRNLIIESAQRPPHLIEEDVDHIEEALKDKVKTRFFADHAKLPEWIDWLDERGHLEAVFDHGELSERDGVLSWWLANRFACAEPEKLLLLIGRHNMRLHPNLWWKIGHEVSKGEPKLNGEILSRWVSTLLVDIPENPDMHHVLCSLGRLCVNQGLFKSLLQITEAMTASRIFLSPDSFWDGNDELAIRAELPTIGANYALWELWNESLKPNLVQVVEPLLRIVIGRLEERHRTLSVWGHSEGRSAIEPHAQNNHSDAPHVLIDSARDCLEWLAENQAQVAATWRNQLSSSDAPLLWRLAIHTAIEEKDLTADEKIAWLLTRFDIHDSKIYHEVFRLAAQSYPEASKKRRATLIEAVRHNPGEGSGN